MPVLRKTQQSYEKISFEQIMKHVNEEILHEENGGAIWETSHRCCVVRKVMQTELLPEEGLSFFWTLIKTFIY